MINFLFKQRCFSKNSAVAATEKARKYKTS